jgi:Arc/MetJ-type ribon-helix-helix transcriptional regulator
MKTDILDGIRRQIAQDPYSNAAYWLRQAIEEIEQLRSDLVEQWEDAVEAICDAKVGAR